MDLCRRELPTLRGWPNRSVGVCDVSENSIAESTLKLFKADQARFDLFASGDTERGIEACVARGTQSARPTVLQSARTFDISSVL